MYRHLVSAQQHCEDSAMHSIFTHICYELLYTYLLVQASQWHTIHSKQFAFYEAIDGGKSEDEDGLETIVYLFEYLFYHLHGIHVTLSPSSVDETPFIYFCTMLSDRLRAEPYLLNSYLRLLTAIASTSKTSAEAVYQLIDSAPSEHVSWAIMMNALNECQTLVERDGGQRSLIDTDLTGLCAMLGLMIQVMKNTMDCPSILSSIQGNTVHLCIRLLYQPVHVILKTQLVQFLTCVVDNPAYAKLVLQQMEVGHMIDDAHGLLYELDVVESSLQAYPLTLYFLQLITKLLQVLGVVQILESPVFPPILDFMINRVLLQAELRNYLPHRNGEKWELANEVLIFLRHVVQAFMTQWNQWDSKDKERHMELNSQNNGSNQGNQGSQRSQGKLYNQSDNWNNEIDRNHKDMSSQINSTNSTIQSRSNCSNVPQLVQNRFCEVITSILSNSSLIQKLFRFLDLVPGHSLLDLNILPTDCIAESSLYINSRLFDAFPAQLHLLETTVYFLGDMLQITTETISRLSLHVTALPSNFVSSIASQLLTDSNAILALFLCLSYDEIPSLQHGTLHALRLFCDQIRPELLLSLLDSRPYEMEKIRISLVTILRRVSFSKSGDNYEETCGEFLSLCEAYAKDSFPSITTTLLGIPAVFQQNGGNSDDNVFMTLLDFLNNVSLVANHIMLASQAMRLLWLLCSHHEVTIRQHFHS